MGLLASPWALKSVIVALMRIAKAGEGSENVAAVKAARLALIDAARLAGNWTPISTPTSAKLLNNMGF